MFQNAMFDMPINAVETENKYAGKYIYETKGRAREYRELACNLYTGCDHECIYCYAPNILQRQRSDFYERVLPRGKILENIEKESKLYAAHGEKRQVLFCFACDPYSHADVEYQLTRQAIKICHRNRMDICVLTKGGLRSLRDLDLFTPFDSYACTLTSLYDKVSLEWEPGAALPGERIDALKEYNKAGIQTWVSLEPVIDPEWTFQIIKETHQFVDEFKVGKLNYHEKERDINWTQFGRDAVALLDKIGSKYYIKHDLRILL